MKRIDMIGSTADILLAEIQREVNESELDESTKESIILKCMRLGDYINEFLNEV